VDGRRLDRHGAGRIVRKTARRAAIGKTVTPHTLRHAFITPVGCRSASAGRARGGVARGPAHYDAVWAGRARGSLDRHATYIVAAYVAGAAR